MDVTQLCRPINVLILVLFFFYPHPSIQPRIISYLLYSEKCIFPYNDFDVHNTHYTNIKENAMVRTKGPSRHILYPESTLSTIYHQPYMLPESIPTSPYSSPSSSAPLPSNVLSSIQSQPTPNSPYTHDQTSLLQQCVNARWIDGLAAASRSKQSPASLAHALGLCRY